MRRAESKVYGIHACRAVFETRPDDVLRAWVVEERVPAVGDLLRELARARRPYKLVPAEELARIAGARHHEGICLLVRERPAPSLGEVLGAIPEGAPARMVWLDGVANPHNVGAVLRVCAHFGVLAAVGTELPPPSGAARRVAEGGAEHVPSVALTDPRAAFDALGAAGFAAVATAANAPDDLFVTELPARCVYLIGAERAGLSPRLRAMASRTVRIGGTGAVESLNVSTACAVLLAEHWRRYEPSA